MSPNQRSTDNLLRRYLSGALTAPEEAELERRALTDEPLAEAMQGVQSFPEADHEARVAKMLQGARSQVQGEVGGAKVRPLRRNYVRLAAAASVVLLFVACALFFLPQWIGMEPGEMAMKSPAETPVAEPPNTPADDAVVAESVPPAPGTEATPPAPPSPTQDLRPRPKTTPAAPAATASKAQESARRRAQEIAKRNQSARRESTTKNRSAAAAQQEARKEAESIAEETAIQAAPPAAAPVAPAPPERPASSAVSGQTEDLLAAKPSPDDDTGAQNEKQGSYLEGRITNENGFPIRNALVRLAGLPIGERTDSNGYFRLPADAAASRIEVSHPDYEDETMNLRGRPENLQLSMDRKAWEAERPNIIQNGSQSTIVIDKKPGYAAPIEGYGPLRKRLEANKPVGIPVGKIKFSFTVNTDGSLTDFEFRGKPSQEVMDYIGKTIVTTSVWEITQGREPVRVYMKVVL